MTGERRERLRQLVDQVRRERLTGGLGDDPTHFAQCWHCGRHFPVGRYSIGNRFCSESHRITWGARKARFYKITEKARL